jgi:hypothetical protein
VKIREKATYSLADTLACTPSCGTMLKHISENRTYVSSHGRMVSWHDNAACNVLQREIRERENIPFFWYFGLYSSSCAYCIPVSSSSSSTAY